MAAAVIEFLRFANRAVKFQAITLCLKPGARRKVRPLNKTRARRQNLQVQPESKFAAMGEILAKFRQAFDAAHKILIKFRRAIPLRRIKFRSART